MRLKMTMVTFNSIGVKTLVETDSVETCKKMYKTSYESFIVCRVND